MKTWLKKGWPIAAGLGLGYLYYYFIGCRHGTCPISSSPYTCTIYGGILGLLLARTGTFKKGKDS